MRKLAIVLLVALVSVSGLFAAARTETAENTSSNWKIAVVTSTVTQGEEPYRAGKMAVDQYGSEHIVHVTLNFLKKYYSNALTRRAGVSKSI